MDDNIYPELKSRKLHAYAASFSDDLARNLIGANTEEGDICLDPFVGAATSLLQARLMRRSGIGIDVDPVACLISRVLTASYNSRDIAELHKSVTERLELVVPEFAKADFVKSSFMPGDQISLCKMVINIPNIKGIAFWFTPMQRALLATLAKMGGDYNQRQKDLINLTLSSSIIHKWPNTISQARDIDHSRPHRVIRDNLTTESQLKIFTQNLDRITKFITKLNELTKDFDIEFDILMGDACELLNSLKPNTIDYVLTSPPYFNAIDYPRSHRLAQWWLWEDENIDRRRYVGLKSGKWENEMVKQCENLIPMHVYVLRTLSDISLPLLSSFCMYLRDMNEIIQEIARVLKGGKNLSFVLANNNIKGVQLPVVEIVQEMLIKNGFSSLNIEKRTLEVSKRRYPYGIKGFKGLMEFEYIITATKMK